MRRRTLGKQIQQLRGKRGWTQDQLAHEARLSRIYIQKLELGERISPSFAALERIARALGVMLRVSFEVHRGRRKRRT